MRFKSFVLALVLALISVGYSPAERVYSAPQSHSAAEALFPELHFSSRNQDTAASSKGTITPEEIVTALSKLPYAQAATVKNVVLDYDAKAHRGLGGGGMVILRAVNMEKTEFLGVLIHELGHNVDLVYLGEKNTLKASPFKDGESAIYESDASVDFYRVSWLAANKLKKEASNLDFVSGYAMSDPFEDFAESYAYFVLHNRDFKALAESNKALQAKYDFMKNQVFAGQVFDTGSTAVNNLRRPWDVTVIPYDLVKFLGA